MKEELVKFYSYTLDREIIEKCREEERDIKNSDVKITIHSILEDNNLEYKNKLRENWIGFKRPRYDLIVEIFVYKKDLKRAKELLQEYRS